MNLSRFEIRPIASRRLRAALLLVFVLGLYGLSQTRLNGAELVVSILALSAIFADGWRRTRTALSTLIFNYRPLGCSLIDADGVETPLHCRQASVYPWLVVLKFEPVEAGSPFIRILSDRALVLLPDSLPEQSRQHWRPLLIWANQMRRQLSNG